MKPAPALRVVFAGTPAFAVPALEYLCAAPRVNLVAVYTQPDRPAGRGNTIRAGAVKQFAAERGLPVLQPAAFHAADIARLKKLQPDLMVVAAYGLILPPAVLAIPKLGCVNLHASILPRWRGAAPVPRAIEAGDVETGVSLMQMNEELDGGAVLACAHMPIAADDTGGGLQAKLAHLSAECLAANWDALAARKLTAVPQPAAGVCYAPKLRAREAPLDWRMRAAILARKVRALHPWPMAAATVNDIKLKIIRAQMVNAADAATSYAGAAVGEIIALDARGITVKCGDGALRLLTAQRPGGRPMPAADLSRGLRLVCGMRFAVV